MRVKSKNVQVRFYTDLTVTSDTNGAIVFHGRMDNGECWHKALQPKDAVQVWRRMMGETEEALHIPSPHLDVKYDEHDETWTFSDNEVLCVLDADECMLVAWAIEKSGGIALYNGPVFPRNVDKAVWVLSSRRLLTGDVAGDGTELIGGHEEVFASKDAALGSLRSFLEPLVRESHPEGHFDGMLEDVKTLSDTLDEIMEEEGHPDEWLYDGSTQSFEVSLSCHEVKQ